MWFLMLLIGFALAVLVMPPTLVETTQRIVRRTVTDLAKKIRDKTDDDKKEGQ